MIRVLVFSREAKWYGGVVNFINLIKTNINDDVQVVVFTIGRRKGSKGILFRVLIPLYDAFRLSRVICKYNYDAYHLNPSLDIQSLIRDGLFLIILRMYNVKNIYIVFHGWKKSLEEIIINNRIFKFIVKKIFNNARNILVLSEDIKRSLVVIGINEDKILLYTTMFDSRLLYKKVQRKERKSVEVLFLSRLIHGKGAYQLIEAFSNIYKKYHNIKLTIAGIGPEEAGLKRLVSKYDINNRVEFTGYIRNAAKVDVLNRSDIFVLASDTEGCPVSMLEAMASGLAVIATPVGGIPGIVKDGINGFLINDSTPGSIENALIKLLDNPSLLKAISKQNTDEAWEKYNAPAVTTFFENIYKSGSI